MLCQLFLELLSAHLSTLIPAFLKKKKNTAKSFKKYPTYQLCQVHNALRQRGLIDSASVPVSDYSQILFSFSTILARATQRRHWVPCEMTSEEPAQKFHTDARHSPDQGSA